MPSSNLSRAIRRARQRIDTLEGPVRAEMAALYANVVRNLYSDFVAVTEMIETARRNGEPVSPDWLRRQDRYLRLMAQAEREYARFAEDGMRLLDSARFRAVRGGAAEAWELADAAGVTTGFGANINTVAVESTLAATRSRALRRSLAQYGEDGAKTITNTLLDGIARGRGPRQIQRDIERQLTGPYNRSRLEALVRTEMMRGFRAGLNDQYAAMAHLIEGYRWTAAKGKRTCLACLAMDGKVQKRPWTPFHVQCFTAGTVVNGPLARAATKRWYEGELIEIVTASNQRLSVTPNHPILTPDGWVAAGSLHEGGNVVRYLNPQGPTAAINPDYENRPTLIEDVAESLMDEFGSVARHVPGTPEDFHGDGSYGEVDVVLTDRLLWDALQPSIKQPSVYEQLVGRHVGLPGFADERPPFHLSNRPLPTTHSVVGGDSESLASSWGGLRHTCEHRLGFVAWRDTGIAEALTNHGAGDPEILGQRLLGLTGNITTDQILNVQRRDFRGHVYNLETEEGWYISNSIITHNCRCISTPVPIGSTFRYETGPEWFARQGADVQRRMLPTQAAYEAWRDGRVNLDDFVGVRHDRVWGRSVYQRSGRQALEAGT